MHFAEERKLALAAQVRRILASANIPRHDYAKVLCDVLNIAIAQSYRKLNGKSDYTFPQIAALEEHFGVTLIHIAVEDTPSAYGAGVRQWTDAVLHVEGRQVPCRIIVGGALRADSRRPFAAYLERGHWIACLVTGCKETAPLFEVEWLLCNDQSITALSHSGVNDPKDTGSA